MNSDRDEQIFALIERLSNDIGLARKLSLSQTAQLLEMAKLELQTIVHSISDEELRLFTLAIEEAQALAPICDSPALASVDIAQEQKSVVTRRSCRESRKRGVAMRGLPPPGGAVG